MNTVEMKADYLNSRTAAEHQAKRIEEHARALGLSDASCVASDGGVTLTTSTPVPVVVLAALQHHYGVAATVSVSGHGSVGIVL